MISTVIFWTELYCWHKSYSNKATLFLGRSNRYKQSTVVITFWLTVTNYPYNNFKRKWILYSLRTFFPFISAKTFTGCYDSRLKKCVSFAFTSCCYLIYDICVCSTHIVQFFGLSIIDYPFGILWRLFYCNVR